MTEAMVDDALVEKVARAMAPALDGYPYRDDEDTLLDHLNAARAAIAISLDEAAKIVERKMRQHRRYIRNGRKNGLSDAATHNDHVMALALRDIATAIRKRGE